MKINKLKIIFLSLLMVLLTACNNNNDNDKDVANKAKGDDNISSFRTDLDSRNYPHTVPIKIQDAKYEFKTIIGKYTPDGQIDFQESDKGIQFGDIVPDQGPNVTQKKNDKNAQKAPAPQTQQPAQQPQQPQAAQPKQQTPPANNADNATQGVNKYVATVIRLTNEERSKAGLPALKADSALNNVADVKAQDMYEKGYFSHTSPTYGSPFDMMRDFGISYSAAGENIAQGQKSPEEVVKAWMNSEGHRKNILDNKYTHIGVGYEQGGNQWVQMFIKK
ncbi:MAG TPA: CAP domain-containing protein [Bacillaceae bacterium]|nr:CAP domain-containing protein [Paenibacillus bovis]HLU21737.1 CAP domain-containing protein [Bacillaceae bacterium]